MKKTWLLLVLCLVLTGCGGRKEVPEVLSLADFDFSGVNSIDILNCRNEKVTQIIYPDQIQEITAFLQTVRGTEPGTEGGEPSYQVSLKAGFDTVLTLTFGDWVEDDHARYRLENPTYEEILEFFAGYHRAPISCLQAVDAFPDSVTLCFSGEPGPLAPGYVLEERTGENWTVIRREELELGDVNWDGNPQNGLWLPLPLTLVPGDYRISVRREGENLPMTGEFSILTETDREGRIPLEAIPADYSQEQAALDGCVVLAGDTCQAGQQAWTEFYYRTMAGNPDSIRVAYSQQLGEGKPAEQIWDIFFDGRSYTVADVGGQETYAHLERREQETDENIRHIFYVLTGDSGEKRTYQETVFLSERPQMPEFVRAELVWQGNLVAAVSEPEALGAIHRLLITAEGGGEPATHSIGMGLNLLAEDPQGAVLTLELDPDQSLFRLDGIYYNFGAPDRPEALYSLWAILGLENGWPEAVYAECPNALRP